MTFQSNGGREEKGKKEGERADLAVKGASPSGREASVDAAAGLRRRSTSSSDTQTPRHARRSVENSTPRGLLWGHRVVSSLASQPSERATDRESLGRRGSNYRCFGDHISPLNGGCQ
ncbi:hypothetical protein OJAV_G00016170 [Oryzias javanicus]|uniref:Uncharacterized protein n=1 Tax=Oryzias javanicus TaxID=123683 RepID=A0A437DKE1_ORYJA|nr:hypothetical protein OJAV_G00016170 [Oryzias javanicus]